MTTTRATRRAAPRASSAEQDELGELAALREIVRLGTLAPTGSGS